MKIKDPAREHAKRIVHQEQLMDIFIEQPQSFIMRNYLWIMKVLCNVHTTVGIFGLCLCVYYFSIVNYSPYFNPMIPLASVNAKPELLSPRVLPSKCCNIETTHTVFILSILHQTFQYLKYSE